MAKLAVANWDLMGRTRKADVPVAPKPDAVWNLPGGNAWVYYGSGNRGLMRPVILSDGFHQGSTDLDEIWDGLERRKFAFPTKLRERRYDLVILGYNDCTASILDNARAATECIFRSIGERQGSAPLAVGGFSMGGLITRYVLAKLEMERMDHQTSTYISFDSPHHGAWMPIGLQAMAHALRERVPALSEQVNSPAARQLLWRHIAEFSDTPREAKERADFLSALSRFGNWPQRPLKLGVANGAGRGNNDIPAGQATLHGVPGTLFDGFALYSQAAGNNQLVFQGGPTFGDLEKRTSELPEADGAHGGMLESFGLAFNAMNQIPGALKCPYPSTCFVPTGSALAIANGDPWQNLSKDISNLRPDETHFDAFKCASQNERHTTMTEELGAWLLDRLPR